MSITHSLRAGCDMQSECDTAGYYTPWADSTSWDDTVKTVWYVFLRNDGYDSISSAPIDSATRNTQVHAYIDSVNGYFASCHIVLDYDIVWIRSSPMNCDTTDEVLYGSGVPYANQQYGIYPDSALNLFPLRSMDVNFATVGTPILYVALVLTALHATAYVTAHEAGHTFGLDHEAETLMAAFASHDDTFTATQGYKMRCFLHQCLGDILK